MFSFSQVNAPQDDAFTQKSQSKHHQNPVTMKCPPKSLVKSGRVSSADGKVHEKGSAKNVSFAPRPFVYSFDNTENLENITTSQRLTDSQNITRTDNSIIIEAPYVLAAKNISNSINIIENCGRKRSKSPISPDCLPIPSNISKPLPGIANLPVTVAPIRHRT